MGQQCSQGHPGHARQEQSPAPGDGLIGLLGWLKGAPQIVHQYLQSTQGTDARTPDIGNEHAQEDDGQDAGGLNQGMYAKPGPEHL